MGARVVQYLSRRLAPPTNKDFSSLVQAAEASTTSNYQPLHFGITLPYPQLPVALMRYPEVNLILGWLLEIWQKAIKVRGGLLIKEPAVMVKMPLSYEISDTNQNGQSGISANTDGQFNSIKEIGYSCRCEKK